MGSPHQGGTDQTVGLLEETSAGSQRIQRMIVDLILAGKRFLGGDKNEGETGGHDFGITISRATILMILSATGTYPVYPFRGKPMLRCG